ncbi:MAG: NACHT domain-containing protein [Anaerolineae bacterium]
MSNYPMHVFISCSENDLPETLKLYREITTWDHAVWMEQQTTPPDDYLQQALSWSDITLLILTQQALDDPRIQDIWQTIVTQGAQHRTQLIGLRLDDSDPPSYLMQMNVSWLNMHPHNHTRFSELSAYLSIDPANSLVNRSLPIHHDPYSKYLQDLHDQLEQQLAFLLIGTDDHVNETTLPRTQRTFTDANDVRVSDFQSAYEHYERRVFLVGEEGVGKTITLLRFARDAVLARMQDSRQPLPIVAHVRRWHVNKAPRLAQWLAAQSAISPEAIQDLIDNGEALLILDGIDELARKRAYHHANNTDHLEACSQFLQRLPTNCPTVLSGNLTEYQLTINTLAPLHLIALHPLTDEQIHAYLQASPATAPLWRIIEQVETLRDVLRVPLMLEMLAFGFRDAETALDKLRRQDAGVIKDAIFKAYVARRHQQETARYGGKAPFSLQQVFAILSMIASRGVVRYGTGQVTMVTINQPDWDDLLVIDELRFGFIGDNSPYGSNFLEFAEELRLITPPDNGIGSCAFIHTIVRDLLVIQHCLPVREKINSFTAESLSRISDLRKYEAFIEIIRGDYGPNHKLQAWVVLKADPSDHALLAILRLAESLNHDYFSSEIETILSKRLPAQSTANLHCLHQMSVAHPSVQARIQHILDKRMS